MYFCPGCSSVLMIESSANEGRLQFACRACPYIYPLQKVVSNKTHLKRKQVEDVMGGADAWKNVDRTDATCPKCENTRAYYMQIQIRSADEPSSIFYKCCNAECNFQWREG